MSTTVEHVKCLIIGSGPAGQRAAIQGAKLGKRVGLVEKREVVGGAGEVHVTMVPRGCGAGCYGDACLAIRRIIPASSPASPLPDRRHHPLP